MSSDYEVIGEFLMDKQVPRKVRKAFGRIHSDLVTAEDELEEIALAIVGTIEKRDIIPEHKTALVVYDLVQGDITQYKWQIEQLERIANLALKGASPEEIKRCMDDYQYQLSVVVALSRK